MTNRLENVEALAPVANKPTGSCYRKSAVFAEPLMDRPLATAKDSATSSPNVGGKAGAVNGEAEGERPQHCSDPSILVVKAALKNSIAKIDENIFARLPGIGDPAFNPDTEITVEEVFEVDTTAPGVIGQKVAVILPVVCCENVGSPQTGVKLVIGVPLRARWWSSYLLHFLSGIGLSGKSDRSDYPES